MARFDPRVHHRRSIRVRGFDYASPGAYFVTFVTHGRRSILGRVSHGAIELSAWGEIVATCWTALPRHAPHVTLDEWVVMPNHVHAILWLADRRGGASGRFHAQRDTHPPDASPQRPIGTSPGSIGAIIQNVKSIATRRIHQAARCGRSTGPRPPRLDEMAAGAPVWQRNYYERIVRDEAGLMRMRLYIRHNPIAWSAAATRNGAQPW